MSSTITLSIDFPAVYTSNQAIPAPASVVSTTSPAAFNATIIPGELTTISLTASASPGQTQVSVQTLSLRVAAVSTTSSSPSAPRTSTVSTSSTVSISELQPSTKTYSEGTTAGIAVACIIVSILLTALVAWLLIRRHLKHPDRAHNAPGRHVARPYEATNKTVAEAHANGFELDRLSALDEKLPSPLEQSAIAKRFSTFETHIRNHVRSFYQAGHHGEPLDDDQRSALRELLQSSSPVGIERITSLIADPKSRQDTIRFLLAWSILSGIDPSVMQSNFILPSALSHCHRAAEASVRDEADRVMLLSKWRHITGVLLRSGYSQSGLKYADARDKGVERLAELLNAVLAKYGLSRTDMERRRNMEELVKLGAGFGYTLYTQPSGWEFDWDRVTRRESNELVIYPALLQVVDDHGRKMSQPQRYGDVKIIRV